MNCAVALEAMLDADPEELEGSGSTTLAAHVASCGRCGAVAHRILGDTRLLAAAIDPATPATKGRRIAAGQGLLIPAGIAAALLFIVASHLQNVRSGQETSEAAPPVVVAEEPAVPGQVTAPVTPVAGRSLPATPARALPAALPITAVPIKSLTAAVPGPSSATVMVDPPDGRRVAVIRTDNPKFTVVWLH